MCFFLQAGISVRMSLAQKVFFNLQSTENTGRTCAGAGEEAAQVCGALQSEFEAENRERYRKGLGGNIQSWGKYRDREK